MGKIIGSITTLLLLGGVGVAIWYFLGKPENFEEVQDGLGDAFNRTKDQIDNFDFGDVLDSLEGFDFGQFFNDDPFAGNTTVTLWQEKFIERDNGGLQLTIVNSLSEEWQEEFDVALADWQESEALTLSVEVEPVDNAWENEKKCKRQDGLLVVCNGNFGETGWVGICENEVLGGRIISAVAKMNEYYLNNADFAERRFTMCHEIGHAFGLPHTDENFYNKNLFNCLDYTNDPSENLLPGEVNMVKLKEVYLATERERRMLRRVENSDGSVTETIGWVVKNEDNLAEAWNLDVVNE